MNDIDIEDTRQPKDEPEAEYCESCGQEMEFHSPSLIDPDPYFECNNQFCPEKWTNEIVHNMAEHLVEVEQELADTKLKLKSKQHALDVISRLTPSQSNVVVRDTEYAIKMMEDAIEYAYLECDMNGDGRRTIWKEWSEVKKILQQGE